MTFSKHSQGDPRLRFGLNWVLPFAGGGLELGVRGGVSMKRAILFILLFAAAWVSIGCATTAPREQALTGQPEHERHATGYKSQSGLN